MIPILRRPLAAAAALVLLALSVLAVLPAAADCEPWTYPLPAAECDAPTWATWDGAQIVRQHYPYRSIAAQCQALGLSPGWAILRESAADYPVVDQTLWAVAPEAPVVELIGGGQGCVTSGYATAWRSEADIAAAVETLGRQAARACAREIVAGSLSGQDDHEGICAIAAGVAERRRTGESITDPGEQDAATWCATWTRDCSAPNMATARAIVVAAKAARAARLADPDATAPPIPDPSLGWTHPPQAPGEAE